MCQCLIKYTIGSQGMIIISLIRVNRGQISTFQATASPPLFASSAPVPGVSRRYSKSCSGDSVTLASFHAAKGTEFGLLWWMSWDICPDQQWQATLDLVRSPWLLGAGALVPAPAREMNVMNPCATLCLSARVIPVVPIHALSTSFKKFIHSPFTQFTAHSRSHMISKN